MKVIVTGAASFIGSAVVRNLLDAGDDVCAIVRPGSQSTERFKKMIMREYPNALASSDEYDAAFEHSAFSGYGASSHVQLVELNLQRIGELPDILKPQDLCGSCSHGLSDALDFDVFLHAGWEGAGSANRAKEDVQSSNIALSIDALKTAEKLGCKRFLFTGSQAEYGIVQGPAREDTPTDPISPYGKAKVAVSKEAIPLSRELGIEYVHARLYSVYGPGDHESSLISSCLHTWKNGETIKLGPCTQQWNFLYIADAAAALTALLNEGKPGFYNVASEDTRSLSDYIKEMADICSAQGLYTFGERAQNAEGAADLIPDISKIKRDTSWRPVTSFREGISVMWGMEDHK